ncbi:hypothetical protein LTR94_007351 [Friedmanniomyces endolithicus]|nr:hypothetical protein LTR94_007351 [Friedmanniomyces endolithicus]
MTDLSSFPITQRWPAFYPDRLQLYAAPTPNGVKVSMMLEETGLPYEPHFVDISNNESKDPAFVSLNPNGRIPAIIDPAGPDGQPIGVWETGAILVYLADKTGQFISTRPTQRYETLAWVFFQVSGIGPTFGQLGFFLRFAGKDYEDKRPRQRFVDESKRLLGVLDRRLESREWIVDDYSIADIATFGWVNALLEFYAAGDILGLSSYPNVLAWACMTIIAAYYYNEGKRVREIALDERIELGESRSGFCWIALTAPTEGELRAIQTTYNLHPLAIDNAMHPLCPPKLEVYNDELYIVAQTAELVGDRIVYGKMAIFTGHNHLITVRHGNAGALGKLRAQLEASPTQFGKGVDYVLHAILHRVVDQYLPIFEMIEDDVLAMERRSLHDFLGPEEVARIFELRSELTRFQRTLGAMAELVRKLVRGHFPCISAEMTPYFHDVADHVHRVQSMVDGLLLVLSTVFEASSLLEAQRIGVVTRQLAAWAAILAVPTAIAGIYGMNFKNMPELNTTYGYFVVLGLIAVSSLILFARFKKSKWL